MPDNENVSNRLNEETVCVVLSQPLVSGQRRRSGMSGQRPVSLWQLIASSV